jgi:hypothetical protein
MSCLDHDLGETKGYMVWWSVSKMGSLRRSSLRQHDIGLRSRWGLSFAKIHDSDRTFNKFTIVTERSEFKMGSLRRSSPR